MRLYGTADKGDYNGAFKYAWKFVSESRGAALEKANTRNPHFTPSAEGKYKLQFVVNVGEEAKAVATNTVIIHVTSENLPPVVKVGEGGDVPLNEPVMLNATSTFDPNGDELTYEWNFLYVPVDSNLTDASITGSQFPGPTSKLKGASYYLFFAGMMLLAALVFIPVAMAYKPKEYLQDEQEAGESASE